MNDREEEGLYILSCLWMTVARKLVDHAATFYSLSDIERKSLYDRFLKPGSYQIHLVDET